MTTAESKGGTSVRWRPVAADSVAEPLVRRVPYLEAKLEHPELEATGHGDRFFPDSVPYSLGGEDRIFYWRPALSPSVDRNGEWLLACATTHELEGIDELPAMVPALADDDGTAVTVVVDGTVAGETTTARLDSYRPAHGRVEGVSDTDIELVVDGSAYTVPRNVRRRIELSERYVQPVGTDTASTTVTPELTVRYPGRRVVHHPSPGSGHGLFPSFGLALDGIPNPLPVPTTAGELDESALAARLGVDLSERPYPERVLWQAFAYTAFDPHSDAVPELAQVRTGHLVLRNAARM